MQLQLRDWKCTIWYEAAHFEVWQGLCGRYPFGSWNYGEPSQEQACLYVSQCIFEIYITFTAPDPFPVLSLLVSTLLIVLGTQLPLPRQLFSKYLRSSST